jgi:hypothetical protein
MCRIFNDARYKSSVGYPALTFFPEIFEQNPDIKVVLSQRDSAEVFAHLSFYLGLAGLPLPESEVQSVACRCGQTLLKKQALAIG